MKRTLVVGFAVLALGVAAYLLARDSTESKQVSSVGAPDTDVNTSSLPALGALQEPQIVSASRAATPTESRKRQADDSTNRDKAERDAEIRKKEREFLEFLVFSKARDGGAGALLDSHIINPRNVMPDSGDLAAFQRVLEQKLDQVNAYNRSASDIAWSRANELFALGLIDAEWTQNTIHDVPPPLPPGLDRLAMPVVTLSGTHAKRVVITPDYS